jgi:endonuclease III-like uncharacterized protein
MIPSFELPRALVDEYTRRFVQAQTTVLAEYSGRIAEEVRALYEEVNNTRHRVALIALEVPDHYKEKA